MAWKEPRDGKAFVGFMAGSRRDTREAFKKVLWERYGIKIIFHIGEEQRRDHATSWAIPSHCEVVVLITDDIKDSQLQQVMAKQKILPNAVTVGITYAERRQPQKWDSHFAANGFSCPPKWRDGALIPNIADKKALEEERKAELAAIEETRTAWVDPALREGPKLGDAVAAVLEKYKPQLVEEPKKPAPAKKPEKGRGGPKATLPGVPVPSPPGFASEVRAAREKLGLSQGQFGQRLGTSQTAPSTWERGQGVPSYEIWVKLHKLCPEIKEPPGIKGKKAYDKRHEGEVEVEKPAAPVVPVALKIQTQRVTEEPKFEIPKPVVEAVAPPPAQVAAPVSPPVVPAAPVAAVPAEELLTINLKSGGTLTLMASVHLLKLKGEDRAFVFDVIDKLQSYNEEKK
jgi:transcriptional regulator with XRE-family HTH domain